MSKEIETLQYKKPGLISFKAENSFGACTDGTNIDGSCSNGTTTDGFPCPCTNGTTAVGNCQSTGTSASGTCTYMGHSAMSGCSFGDGGVS